MLGHCTFTMHSFGGIARHQVRAWAETLGSSKPNFLLQHWDLVLLISWRKSYRQGQRRLVTVCYIRFISQVTKGYQGAYFRIQVRLLENRASLNPQFSQQSVIIIIFQIKILIQVHSAFPPFSKINYFSSSISMFLSILGVTNADPFPHRPY